jgi:hypothetical protein
MTGTEVALVLKLKIFDAIVHHGLGFGFWVLGLIDDWLIFSSRQNDVMHKV